MNSSVEQGEETLAGRPAYATATCYAMLWAHAVDTTAGGYEVLRTIGTGSFGTALLVRTRATGKLVVIKQIRLQELGTKDRLEAMNEVVWVLAAADAAAWAGPIWQQLVG